MADATAALAAIRLRCPGWRPWLSDAGRFWATRIGSRLPEHPAARFAMTVDGDTAEQLIEAIAAQPEQAA